MRSADVSRFATAAASLLLAGGLAGCVETTQQKNARVQLQDDRLIASRSPVQVSAQDPNITVLGVSVLRTHTGTAVAVTLRNDSSRPVSDLPISVGVTTASRRADYLNGAPELPYFQTHVAAIPGGGATTWVFTAPRQAPDGRPFARVGHGTIAIDAGVTRLPSIASSVTAVRAAGAEASTAVAQIDNRSGVAQSGLEVYAYGFSGDRLVAAGAVPLGSLGSGSRASLSIPLLGNPRSSAVQLQIPPTNLR